jgi:lipoyl-dependent peroxiredoxin
MTNRYQLDQTPTRYAAAVVSLSTVVGMVQYSTVPVLYGHSCYNAIRLSAPPHALQDCKTEHCITPRYRHHCTAASHTMASTLRRLFSLPLRSVPSSPSFRSLSTLYTANTHTVGGRTGSSRSDDGRLSVSLSSPKELGGKGGDGTNPEQLFAAGYSACFLGAMSVAAKNLKTSMPPDAAIDAKVELNRDDSGALSLSVQFDVSGSGSKDDLRRIVEAAHTICPYSRATKNNIPFKFNIV